MSAARMHAAKTAAVVVAVDVGIDPVVADGDGVERADLSARGRALNVIARREPQNRPGPEQIVLLNAPRPFTDHQRIRRPVPDITHSEATILEHHARGLA